jgi:hypothetical protein
MELLLTKEQQQRKEKGTKTMRTIRKTKKEKVLQIRMSEKQYDELEEFVIFLNEKHNEELKISTWARQVLLETMKNEKIMEDFKDAN